MTYAKIYNCQIYKENQIVVVNRYLYDKKLNRTNKLYDDATLEDIVAGYHAKTIHGHFILLSNTRPLVTIEDLRFVKIKKLLNG